MTNKSGKMTMKEALEKLPSKRKLSKISKKKDFDLRDILWNYPYWISQIFKKSSPFGYILIFLVLGFGLFSFLRSDVIAQRLTTKRSTQLTVGHIGAISTFNPLFITQNDIDKIIQEMVFTKLVYFNEDGEILPGIASDWVISENGKIYEFNISDQYYWHDGVKVTVDDVIFTFQTAIELSKKHDYDTIGSAIEDVKIEKSGINTVKFTLDTVSATFPEAVSVYIVPKHILEDVALFNIPFSRFARVPTGSGPYLIQKSEPSIVTLKASEFWYSAPEIGTVIFRLFTDEASLESAFRNGLLDGLVVNATKEFDFVEEYTNFESFKVEMPFRQRMLFFNTRKDKFESTELRVAISRLVNIQKILEDAGIYGIEALGPIPDVSWAFDSTQPFITYDPEAAAKQFNSLGYTKNEQNGYFESSDGKILTFTLSYLDNALNEKIVTSLQKNLSENGIIMNLEPLSYNQLTQEIITTRNFEVLMYEISMELDPDQYSLWHKLQAEHPDLNLSGYSYERVDILLEDARKTIDRKVRLEKYALVQRYIVRDAPVIFLYHPEYLVVLRSGIEGIQKDDVVRIENLFGDMYNWKYTD